MKEFDFTSLGQFISENKKKTDNFSNEMNVLFNKINKKIKELDGLSNDTTEIEEFLFSLQDEFLMALTSILSYATVFKNTKHPHNELLLKIEGILIKNIRMLNLEEFSKYKKEYHSYSNLPRFLLGKIKTYLIEFRYDVITMQDIWVND